ncbi:MAG: S-layer homology domain-containing protein [Clostridiaceae bacterium]|nr:S-layer homology domain-containing protein [Clostridiaceae bacterium]
MKKIARLLAFLLCLAILLPTAFADDADINAIPASEDAPAEVILTEETSESPEPAPGESRHPDELARLICCGFFTGSDKGLELDRALTRSEAAVLVVRVMGAAYDLPESSMPFTDVAEWAAPYVSYLYNTGAVRGVSDTLYGANDPVTAQQFYTMLLRTLGYSDANGDFTYAAALDFASTLGLIDDTDAARVETAFVRDDAAFACARALCTTPKGGKTAYAFTRAERIENSYTDIAAEIITGTNKIYDLLTASSAAVSALSSYTLSQSGTYKMTGKTVNIRDTIQCDARILPGSGAAFYTLDIVDRSTGETVLDRSIRAFVTDKLLAIYSDDAAGWDSAELPETLADHYVGVYNRLFGPDLIYCTNFDYTEKDGVATLSGFQYRFELMADMTSNFAGSYYFDMLIKIDLKTMLPLSIVCSYKDTWEKDGEPVEVVYTCEYALKDINHTTLPMTDHGLDAYLKALGE